MINKRKETDLSLKKKYKKFTKEQLIYFAGLFDGEGSVLIKKFPAKGCNHNPCYQLCLCVSNTYLPILSVLKEHGWFFNKKNISGVKRAKQAVIRGKPARDVLVSMLPYLVIKKEQAFLALDFQDHVDSFQHRRGGIGVGGTYPVEEVQYRETMKRELEWLRREGPYGITRRMAHE